MSCVSEEPRWADRLIGRQVVEPDRAILEARGDQAAITAKRRTGGWCGGGLDRCENHSGRGVAQLDRAAPSQRNKGTTVGRESACRLVNHRVTDRLPS